jgi:hypothetical protein
MSESERCIQRVAAVMRPAILVVALAFAPAATAAPCAGFTDVDDAGGFCPNVEWLKNRSITLGCSSATLYCPSAPVSRLAMAAFMNRLGVALTPVHLPVNAAPGAIDLDGGAVVCQTADFTVAGFPRVAYVDLAFSAHAAAAVGLAADVAMSVNGGASWTNLNPATNRGHVAANQWGMLTDVATADLSVGQTVRFGVRMSRGGSAGTTQVADSRCQLRVLVHSRNGAASPF